MTTGTMAPAGLAVDALRAAFDAHALGPGTEAPAWLADIRRAAFERFAAGGLPTTRDEAWRYTSLTSLQPMAVDGSSALPGEAAEAAVRAVIPDVAVAGRLVFIDGRYAPHLSAPPDGRSVRAGGLAHAALAHGEVVRASLDEVPDGRAEAFALLNLAFWRDGGFLQLGTDAVLDGPLVLLFVATAAGLAAHPRSLIRLGPGSRATVLEVHVALQPGAYLTNAVTDVALGPGAGLDHVTVIRESPSAAHVGRVRVRQARDSQADGCVLTLGGRLVRREAHVTLDAEGARCRLTGLSLLGGVQHGDVQTVVDHVAPRATSRQLFKAILDGRARSVFGGRVVVRRGADGTDAHQTNKNLLLAEGVQADSKPQLEIFADDVKVSHGAADGQLADDAIFYLRSRGLGLEAARALVAYGFAAEVLAGIRAEGIRTWLGELLAARLRGGRVKEHAA
jgi:Fe-S cluster assembly protein SufD